MLPKVHSRIVTVSLATLIFGFTARDCLGTVSAILSFIFTINDSLGPNESFFTGASAVLEAGHPCLCLALNSGFRIIFSLLITCNKNVEISTSVTRANEAKIKSVRIIKPPNLPKYVTKKCAIKKPKKPP